MWRRFDEIIAFESPSLGPKALARIELSGVRRNFETDDSVPPSSGLCRTPTSRRACYAVQSGHGPVNRNSAKAT